MALHGTAWLRLQGWSSEAENFLLFVCLTIFQALNILGTTWV